MNPKTLEVPGYQVVQFLGKGARSTIWQIRDCSTNELFSLKRVVKHQPSDARFLDQAMNEYDIASQLEHPNLRRIFRLRRIKRWLSVREIHLVMEFCPGKTLQEQRPESIIKIMQVFISAGKALAHMNAKGFVHADTKPNNIIVGTDGQVKIIDMGQSCRIGTVKDRIQGTPDFIAPEQVHRGPLDARTDVFNFGAALYWTLTGKPIPTSLPKKGAVTLVADMVVVPAHKLNPDVPVTLSKLISDCIAVRPYHRLASMNAVVSRLGLISHMLKRTSFKADDTDPDIAPSNDNDVS